jgi:L-aspartate oxidase
MAAGAGLCDEAAVRELVEQGPAAVRWLIEQGTHFDVDGSELELGKEAAHSRNRVLHAGGDATGAEIERSLVAQIRRRPRVTVLEHASAIDLVLNRDGSCGGAVMVNHDTGQTSLVAASVTVLANGGAGRLWSVTSNPPGATGDGIAMALRAGAVLADIEFTQFHPTVLAVPDIEPFLVTEAIRGEGAYLRDSEGRRFMVEENELAELAPRDIVARAIQARIARDGQPVYLDLRHLDPQMVRHRFPTILGRLAQQGLNLTSDLIPVAPAAHYFMGGIMADTRGATSVPGLLAIGEVTCTGVHGANRLASNSLLEGLVFGINAARHLDASALRPPDISLRPDVPYLRQPEESRNDTTELRTEIQQVMGRYVAVVRDAAGLELALTRLAEIEPYVSRLGRLEGAEVQNMHALATAITESALAREESRGGHYREDYPERNSTLDHQHQLVLDADRSTSRWFGPLHQSVRT